MLDEGLGVNKAIGVVGDRYMKIYVEEPMQSCFSLLELWLRNAKLLALSTMLHTKPISIPCLFIPTIAAPTGSIPDHKSMTLMVTFLETVHTHNARGIKPAIIALHK